MKAENWVIGKHSWIMGILISALLLISGCEKGNKTQEGSGETSNMEMPPEGNDSFIDII